MVQDRLRFAANPGGRSARKPGSRQGAKTSFRTLIITAVNGSPKSDERRLASISVPSSCTACQRTLFPGILRTTACFVSTSTRPNASELTIWKKKNEFGKPCTLSRSGFGYSLGGADRERDKTKGPPTDPATRAVTPFPVGREPAAPGRPNETPICFPLCQFSGYNRPMKKSNGHVLERLLDPVSASLNEEAARKLIGLKADAKARARVAELARKCNEGELTAAERADYEMYVLAGDFIAILQAKARLRLSRRGQPA